jgi:Domain of unknown function (DUF4375)
MSPRRTISKAELRDDPYAAWNAYIDLLAMSELADLEPRQRPAHLVFWYLSELENGGHFQYFENRGLELVPETIAALQTLRADALAETLAQALNVASHREWGGIVTVDEFISEALEGTFADLDRAYSAATPSAEDALKQHLQEHRDWFIEIEAET